ncbi:MAG: ABC transporter substrate-binding protein [Desulfurivibrio sp.]|nr:ABC transporter substrate-binding protein [Desulfurivibrio sp.]
MPIKQLLLAIILLAALPAAAAGETVTLTDEGGRTIRFDQPFRRIISLYPGHTENLASLGLDREIVAIGHSDDFPPRLMDRPRVGYRDDPERLLAQRPDLVLVRPMIDRAYPQLLAKLEQAGVTVVSLQPTAVDEIFSYWRQLGKLTGRQAAAEEMIAEFQQQKAAIAAKVAEIPEEQRPRVFFSSIHRRMKTFAPQSIAIFVLESAGGRNIAADAPRVRQTNIADYGKERLLAKGTEIDIFLAQQGRMNPVERETIINEPGFKAIKAVRQGEVHLIDERLVSRPTMRLLTGMRRVGEILYPDRFPTAPATPAGESK